ncbi:heterokaryon incompatibility protein-domain-containing protein [Echria macrotheca]|uniref:Heterokaryon incompatibility protein-domain-containing protein n=1 Tax=Echria macrotheca TaxID=438768 RepID=A0AAJ0BLF9_9PEZI|nr:heterokaryon incompatibility protein-domain-containing protein [Echria macrotheca]
MTSAVPEPKKFHCPENDDFYRSGIYERLDTPDTDDLSIRLLKAVPPDPSDPSAPLRFTLHQHVSLAETVPNPLSPAHLISPSHPYIAISYRAGDPSDILTIFVNDRPFNVFRSLGLGLHRLVGSLGRDKDDLDIESIMYIWADQICINQSDSAEKAVQVRGMSRIYETCSWTYAWLGLDPDVDRGLHGMNRLAHVQKVIVDSLKTIDKQWEDVELVMDELGLWMVEALELLETLEVNWGAVHAFLENEYWVRGWIYQEIIVSGDVTYNTASYENDREGLSRAFKLLGALRNFFRWDFDLHGEELVPKRNVINAADIEKTVVRAQKLVWLHGFNLDLFKFVLDASGSWKQEEGLALHELMLAARHSVVSDPLDKVYAFVGLAFPGYDLTPDYSQQQTTSNVFVQAAVAWIRFHVSLDILSFAEEKTPELGPLLPSWVPDWNFRHATASLMHRWRGDPRRPRASGGLGYQAEIHPHENQNDRVLEVLCVIVDTIANADRAAGRPVLEYGSWEQALAAWARAAGLEVERGFSEINNASYPYVKNVSLGVAFWSTLSRGIRPPKKMRKIWRAAGKRYGEEVDGDSEDSTDEIESVLAGIVGDEGDDERTSQHATEDDDWEDVEHDQDEDSQNNSQDDGNASTPEDDGKVTQQSGASQENTDDPDTGMAMMGITDDHSEDEQPEPIESDKQKEVTVFPDHGSGFSQHHLAMSTTFDKNYVTNAGWRFVRSEKGYFALTRVDVGDGDIIGVLVGADMPFILRPYLDGYRLAGEVYVYGIMHGELFRNFDHPEDPVRSAAREILLY